MTSPQPALAPARGPLFRTFGTVLAGLLAGFALVDAWVGWLDREQVRADLGLHQPDPELAWTNAPGFENELTRIDALGLRSPPIPAGAPADEVRILGVGASLVYGAGGVHMDDVWDRRLQELLDAQWPGRFRVQNGGVMGYSTIQVCRRAIRLIEQVEPDLVLVFARPGRQSLLDNSSARHLVRIGGALVPADLVEGWPGPLRPLAAALHGLLRHSNLYRRHRALLADDGRRDASTAAFLISRAPRTAEVQRGLDRTFDEVEALVRFARERGVALRFVLVPEVWQSGEEAWASWLRANGARGAPPPGTPRREPIDVLAAEIEARGGRTWSFYDVATTMGRRRQHYFVRDVSHWSPEGHRLIAESLFTHLRSEGLPAQLAESRAASPR